jgi:hypothetical protein
MKRPYGIRARNRLRARRAALLRKKSAFMPLWMLRTMFGHPGPQRAAKREPCR